MRRRKIALTGGIASGKTEVSSLLAARGAYIIDTDLLAREVVEPGTPALAAIKERFGAGVIRPAGGLDRAAMASIVFADPDALADLNAIVHPTVRARAKQLFHAAPEDAVVVQVIPLLVETGAHREFDWVIAVDVSAETQLARLMRRNRFSESEALARLASQASRTERLAAADEVIDNSGTLADLRQQVAQLWERLRHEQHLWG